VVHSLDPPWCGLRGLGVEVSGEHRGKRSKDTMNRGRIIAGFGHMVFGVRHLPEPPRAS
jgi:hypothetical protein